MPKSKPPRKKNTGRIAPPRDTREAGRKAAEHNIARGVMPGAPNPLGLDLSGPATLPERRVPDPKVSIGGREINGEAKAQALGDVFGPAAAEFSRKWGAEQASNEPPVTRAQAMEMARAAQTQDQIASDQDIIVGITGPDPVALQGADVTPEQARVYLQGIIAADIDGYTDDLQRLSSTMLMGFQQDGLDIPDAWVTAALDREQREIHREIIEISASAAQTMAEQRRLNLDTELLRLVQAQGDDPADPRLALLSPESRENAVQHGVTIKPDVIGLLTEDIRERLLHVMLGKDDRFEPILGKPTSLRLNPARGIATGDLRKAQMHAIEQGVSAVQCIDPRLDTLLDDGGTHFLLMTDLLDENADLTREKVTDGAPPKAFSAAFVRCQVWAKTAFSGPNQAITTSVTLPLQDFMMTPTVTQILPASHAAYGRNGAHVMELAKDTKIPYFEMSMEELSGASTSTPEYPQVQQGGHSLETTYSEGDKAPLVIPREVFEGLPAATRESLAAQGVRLLG